MLISGLRALRLAHQSLPLSAAAALSAAWRGLATSGGEGGSTQPLGGIEVSSTSSDARSSHAPSQPSQTAAAVTAEQVISIDRSGLFTPRPHSHDPAVQRAAGAHKEPETELVKHLKALIQFRGGPLTLAEFMSEALTNPQHGYYTQRDVFGAAGDFVTSPEISQMMGEMVGIWCVAAWQQLGCPPTLHLVELGPGRGTLMADLLRGTAAFKQFSQALRVSLVEVSPHLRGLQWKALRCAGEPPPGVGAHPAAAASSTEGAYAPHHGSSSSSSGSQEDSGSGSSSSGSGSDGDPAPAVQGVSGWNGARVSWHRSLDEVAAEGGPALYIAHEFLDALPVHQFQKTDRGWCERLVDVASPDSPLHLRMVLSPGPTPAARVLLPRRLRQLPEGAQRRATALEVCPQGMALAESLARRVEASGGAALIIDYGQDGPYEASLQAIKRHAFVGLLEQPGSADLSNRVDYSALRATVEESGAAADCLGPIPQAIFLLGLGIESRLEQLLANATPQQAEALRAGYRRLVGDTEPGAALTEEGMGSSYQAFCIAQRGLTPWPFGAVSVAEDDAEEERQQEGVAAEEEQQGGQQQPEQAPEQTPEHLKQQPPNQQQQEGQQQQGRPPV